MKADDALSGNEDGWGGAREKSWHLYGKRAVVSVDAQAYELVSVLARLSLRTNKDLCAQIFAVGLEQMTGHSIEELCTRKFAVQLKGIRNRTKAVTPDDIRERAKVLTMLPLEHPVQDEEEEEDDDEDFHA